MNRVQVAIGGFFCLIMSAIGWYSYCYFFDYSSPTIEIIGLQQESVYQGDIIGKIVIKDTYKIQELSIFFDDIPFNDTLKRKIGKKEYEFPFEVATKTLLDGKHSLKVEAIDSSYNNNKAVCEIDFMVDNQPLYAAFTKPEYEHNKVLQGRTLHVQFRVNKEIEQAQITFLSHVYEVFLESLQSKVYEAFIPIVCEENPGEYPFVIEVFDKVGNIVVLESKVQVLAYPFKKQKIAVNPEKSKKESENGFLQDEFEKIMQQLLIQSPKKKLWQGKFCAPTDIKSISTEFGVQRVSQERGQYIHQGIDIINDPKSVVWASQSGIVVIKDRYAISGNTVVIDHGYGIFSLFFHLDSFAPVEVGDSVKKGNPIGKLGMTGYATGYHLHWEMRINNIPVDPMQWIKNDF